LASLSSKGKPVFAEAGIRDALEKKKAQPFNPSWN
jgi:hypothetical protein